MAYVVKVLATFSIVAFFIGYTFYGLLHVPHNVEEMEQVAIIYAKRLLARTTAIIGEYIGLGHRIHNFRYLTHGPGDIGENSDIKISDANFDGVRVRIYKPKTRESNAPGFVWIHGGGWITNTVEMNDHLCIEMARKSGILIASIDYRLAPEFIYPMPFDDCYKATVFFLDNAREYGVDPKRIAIGGASAGGNLAAAVALKLRDEGRAVRPRAQVLFVPCLQALDFNSPSYQQNEWSGILPKRWMIAYWLWYARGFDGHLFVDTASTNGHVTAAEAKPHLQYVDHSLVPPKYLHESYAPVESRDHNATLWRELRHVLLDPYFAPLMARDLIGLPEAYVATAEHDVLRDDGVMYATRLQQAGVLVTHIHYERNYHLTIERFKTIKNNQDHIMDVVRFLTSHL